LYYNERALVSKGRIETLGGAAGGIKLPASGYGINKALPNDVPTKTNPFSGIWLQKAGPDTYFLGLLFYRGLLERSGMHDHDDGWSRNTWG
jgi:hypothetical protein